MDLRRQLEIAFNSVDTDKTGLISKLQLEKLLNRLCDLTASEIATIFKQINTTEGHVRFSDFLNVFCPRPSAPTELNRELCKPMTKDETNALRQVFDGFDRDRSGYIDLKELKAMCGKMGKQISDEQAADAMRQLDKNGDRKVAFNEFVLWWTCSPGLGGYNNLVLGFLKGKLALQSQINKTFNRVVRKKVENKDEFSLKANVDITPDKTGTQVQSSACLSLNKKGDGDSCPPCIKVSMGTKDAAVAATISATISKLVASPQLWHPDDKDAERKKSLINVAQEAAKVVVTVNLPLDMFDDDAAKAMSVLQDAAKQVELKIGFGTTFEEILANPDRPLCQSVKGCIFGADVLVGLTTLVGCLKEEHSEILTRALRCVAGIMLDTKINYNHPNLLVVAEKIKAYFLSRPGDAEYVLSKLMCKGVAKARAVMYKQLELEGDLIENGRWIDDAPADALRIATQLVKELAQSCIGIETVSILGLPGSSLEMVVKLDKVNPFPMIDYLFGHLPQPPPGYIMKDDSVKKRLSAEDESRLKVVFDKYDKDKSCKIDLKELKRMLTELGVKVDEYLVEEGMSELDVNGDDTCSFDEFKDWWSCKSSCGGYSSYALTFLKRQMKVSSALAKVKTGMSTASGYIGLGENPDDSYVKFQHEVTPAMVEIQSKMSAAVKLLRSDKKPTPESAYSPELIVQFAAKSESDATDVAREFGLLLSHESVEPTCEMLGVTVPQVIANGDVLTLRAQADAKNVKSFYLADDSADFLQIISLLANAVEGSDVTLASATEFNDLLANADQGVEVTYAGAKIAGTLSCSASGKTLALDALRGLAPVSGLDYEMGVALVSE